MHIAVAWSFRKLYNCKTKRVVSNKTGHNIIKLYKTHHGFHVPYPHLVHKSLVDYDFIYNFGSYTG